MARDASLVDRLRDVPIAHISKVCRDRQLYYRRHIDAYWVCRRQTYRGREEYKWEKIKRKDI